MINSLHGFLLFAFAGLVACTGDEPSVVEAPLQMQGEMLPQAIIQSCSGCHTSGTGAIPVISTMTSGELIERLKTYQSEEANETVMHRLARGYSYEDIETIATYLGAPDE